MNWRQVWLAIGVGLAAALLWFAAASGAYFFYSQGTQRLASATFRLTMPRPSREQRILIVSPHPDDEALGCGGLIQAALAGGAAVRVVFVTNGDGFRTAVERQYRTTAPQPEDFVRFGHMRMQEARRAAARLGLRAQDLRFLGYPDGGLTLLWRYHWSLDRPLRARLTRVVRVPYAGAVRPGAPFSGSELVDLLREQIAEFRPTDVFTTHPSDDHADHAATSAFVAAALDRVRETGALPPGGCRLRYFIVHRGNWPQPQGVHTETKLAPPADLLGLDTHWTGLALTPSEVEAKREAIETYESQTSIMGRFLRSFARTGEVTGVIEPPVLQIHEGAHRNDQSLVPAVLRDPGDDNLVRRLSPGDDITAVLLGQRGGHLCISVQPVHRPSTRSGARVHLRWLNTGGTSGAVELRTWPGPAEIPTAPLHLEASAYEGNYPLAQLREADLLFVDAETKVAGMTVDRTGPRLVLVRIQGR